MTTINHECYVSLEVAKLLKEAGFDWEVNHRWQNWSNYADTTPFFLNALDYYEDSNDDVSDDAFSAPTIEVAQKWLREVKGIWCEVTICFVMEDALMKTKYHVQCISTDYNNSEMFDCHNIETDTPEAAQEAGIKKCLKIILKEK